MEKKKDINILLVEDNEADVELIKALLENTTFLNLKISVKETLLTSLLFLEQNAVDVILLDLGLPDSYGLKSIQKIKAYSDKIPIIVLSGNKSDEIILDAVMSGAQDYLIKGEVSSAQLVKSIHYAVERWKLIESQAYYLDKLEKSELSLRNIIYNAVDGIMIIDENSVVQFVNPKAEEIFMKGYQELVGSKFDIPVDVEEMNNLEISLNGGTIINLDINVVEIEWEKKRAYFATLRDITEKIKMENEKKEIEDKIGHYNKMEAIARLAGGMAHDFNNILATMISYTSMLKMEFNKSDENYENIKEIEKAIKRASLLTKQLLTVSKNWIVQTKVIDINEIIKNYIEKNYTKIYKEVTWQLHLNKEESLVRISPNQVEKVLESLLDNSLEAMNNEGRMIIGTFEKKLSGTEAKKYHIGEGSYVCLEIQDFGIGIKKDIINHIFEPFFTTKKNNPGHGLGLSVLYGIVKQLGGDVFIESEFGIGTTVTVFFPKFLG